MSGSFCRDCGYGYGHATGCPGDPRDEWEPPETKAQRERRLAHTRQEDTASNAPRTPVTAPQPSQPRNPSQAVQAP